jgi:tetratricopeptide (TPR) repeat protein
LRDPKLVKALFRRATALEKLHFYGQAQKDLERLLEIDPTNKEAIVILERLRGKVCFSELRIHIIPHFRLTLQFMNSDASASQSLFNRNAVSRKFKSNVWTSLIRRSWTKLTSIKPETNLLHSCCYILVVETCKMLCLEFCK